MATSRRLRLNRTARVLQRASLSSARSPAFSRLRRRHARRPPRKPPADSRPSPPNGADAGTPDGITKTRITVFIADANTAKVTKIGGYRFQPGAPFGSPPTSLFTTSGPVALHHKGGNLWAGTSNNHRAFRAVSAEAWRVKLYVHACNSAGCSSRVITLDRSLNG